MLVLSRKAGQSVDCGEGDAAFSVTVVSIRGNVVKLGFVAPRSVRILRSEVEVRDGDGSDGSGSGGGSGERRAG